MSLSEPATQTARPLSGERPDSPELERSQARSEAFVLLLTTLGTLMVAIDSTIVILALPTMARDLSAPLETVIWKILIYLLIATVLTTQAGRVGDVLGRSRVYNVGFAVFTIGSALCGFAPTADLLIAARGVQAIGGAIIWATGPAVITSAIPAARRGRAFGFIVLGYSIGAILGILLGGVITSLVGWRYIFFINLPIGVAAVTLGLLYLPRTDRVRAKFDIPGFLTFSAALTFLCYGAIEIASFGASTLYVVYVLLGLALVPVFASIELRMEQPMIDLRVLAHRPLGLSLAALFLLSVGYLSVIFLLTMYLQGLRGLSPLDASLLLVPGYIVGAVAGPYFGRRVDRLGARVLMSVGVLMLVATVLGYSTLTVHSWLGWIPMISLLQGIGAGMFYPANSTAIMNHAPRSALGSVSGLRGTLGNMGMLLSFVLTLTVAAISIPRYVAYEVFLGTTNLTGGVSAQFLDGIHVALIGSAAILAVTAALAWSSGVGAAADVPDSVPERSSTAVDADE